MGFTTAIVGGLAAGFGASKLLSGSVKQAVSAPLPLPQAPSVDDASARGEAISRKRKASQTQSIYSSPLGVSGEAQVARKTLLGQ